MDDKVTAMEDSRDRFSYYVVTALSLSIGWGIRGNFGHEYGAMIPGALAAMAAVVLSRSGRLGARGSVFRHVRRAGVVVRRQHLLHAGRRLHALRAFAVRALRLRVPVRDRLSLGGPGRGGYRVAGRRRTPAAGGAHVAPWRGVCLVVAAGPGIEPWLRARGYELDWYDTDWLAALLAGVAALAVVLLRGGVDRSTSLILHLAVGWWAGFGLLVLGLGLRMTPPRGDNWAGCLGMTAGAIVYCMRTGLAEVARARWFRGSSAASASPPRRCSSSSR